MSFAKELNEIANNAIFNINQTIYKETKEYYSNVLCPKLKNHAENGHFSYTLRYCFISRGKDSYEHDIVSFKNCEDDIASLVKYHGSYGYDLQNLFGYLRGDGFEVIDHSTSLHIRWGDEVQKEI